MKPCNNTPSTFSRPPQRQISLRPAKAPNLSQLLQVAKSQRGPFLSAANYCWAHQPQLSAAQLAHRRWLDQSPCRETRALKARAELAGHTPSPNESSARARSLLVLVVHADLVGVEEAVRQRLLHREAAAVDEVALADQLLRQVPAGLQEVCVWAWTGWQAGQQARPRSSRG